MKFLSFSFAVIFSLSAATAQAQYIFGLTPKMPLKITCQLNTSTGEASFDWSRANPDTAYLSWGPKRTTDKATVFIHSQEGGITQFLNISAEFETQLGKVKFDVNAQIAEGEVHNVSTVTQSFMQDRWIVTGGAKVEQFQCMVQ